MYGKDGTVQFMLTYKYTRVNKLCEYFTIITACLHEPALPTQASRTLCLRDTPPPRTTAGRLECLQRNNIHFDLYAMPARFTRCSYCHALLASGGGGALERDPPGMLVTRAGRPCALSLLSRRCSIAFFVSASGTPACPTGCTLCTTASATTRDNIPIVASSPTAVSLPTTAEPGIYLQRRG